MGGLFSCGVDKAREGCYMKKPKEHYHSFPILNSEWISARLSWDRLIS